MAYPNYWECPSCNRVIRGSKYCYYCGYGADYGKERPKMRGGGRSKEGLTGKQKTLVLVSIMILASVVTLTFWQEISAVGMRSKDFKMGLECANPELIVTIHNKGGRINGKWVFVANGDKFKRKIKIEEGTSVKRAFPSKEGLNKVTVKAPFGKEQESTCFL